MNKIIRKAYPIERLPQDLQAALSTHQWVDIELQPTAATQLRPVSRLVAGRNVHGSEQAIIAHVRDLRKD